MPMDVRPRERRVRYFPPDFNSIISCSLLVAALVCLEFSFPLGYQAGPQRVY